MASNRRQNRLRRFSPRLLKVLPSRQNMVVRVIPQSGHFVPGYSATAFQAGLVAAGSQYLILLALNRSKFSASCCRSAVLLLGRIICSCILPSFPFISTRVQIVPQLEPRIENDVFYELADINGRIWELLAIARLLKQASLHSDCGVKQPQKIRY